MANYHAQEVATVWSTTGDHRISERVLLQYLKWRYGAYGQAAIDMIVVQRKEYGDGFNVWAPEALGSDEKRAIRKLKGKNEFVPPDQHSQGNHTISPSRNAFNQSISTPLPIKSSSQRNSPVPPGTNAASQNIVATSIQGLGASLQPPSLNESSQRRSPTAAVTTRRAAAGEQSTFPSSDTIVETTEQQPASGPWPIELKAAEEQSTSDSSDGVVEAAEQQSASKPPPITLEAFGEQSTTEPSGTTAKITEEQLTSELDDPNLTTAPIAQIQIRAFPDLPSLVDKIFNAVWSSDNEPPIPGGMRRVRWICHYCGTKLYDDFEITEPAAISDLETQLQADNPDRHGLIDRVKGVARDIAAEFEKFISSKTNQALSMFLHNNHQFSSATRQQRHEGVRDDFRLLLCLDVGRVRTRLLQPQIQHVDDDYVLFNYLRQTYYENQNPRRWFTLRSVMALHLRRVSAKSIE
ncbi:hypothetical protein E8E14_007020 [Neopestalotiopsis sp. 37M]|nr:hypothetical protein E8E14_007020 [Neopestalotiopsis sp. 37M]